MSNTKIDNVNGNNSVSVTFRFPEWLVEKLNQLPGRTKSEFVRDCIAVNIDAAIQANKEVDEIVADYNARKSDAANT